MLAKCYCYEVGAHIHIECLPAVKDGPRACSCDVGEDRCFTCGGALVPGVNSDFCTSLCEQAHIDLIDPRDHAAPDHDPDACDVCTASGIDWRINP